MKKIQITSIISLFFIFISPVLYANSCHITEVVDSTGSFCIDGDDAIISSNYCNIVTQEDGVTSSYSSGSCPTSGLVCKINLGESSYPFSISYYNINITQEQCNSLNGFFSGTPDITVPDTVEAPPVQATNSTGTIYSITTTSLDPIGTTTPAASAIYTQAGSQTTLVEDDGSQFTIKENTLVSIHPITTDNNTEQKKITLLHGKVETSIPSSQRDYQLTTPLATIQISSSTASARDNSAVQFTTSYSQNNLDGTLTINVISGTVNITDRNGNISSLAAGDGETVIQNRVPRTSWVLPIDGGKVYGGKVNTWAWTAYPGAASYLLEYNIPTPVFAENNTSTYEYKNKTIPIKNFTAAADLIVLNVPLQTGLDGTIIEARMFAVDAQGNIIGESVSSDKSTFTWKDL